jgi:hypothetical protein
MPCPQEIEMARIHRLSMTGALIVCMVGTQWTGTLFASEEERSSSEVQEATSASLPLNDDGLTTHPLLASIAQASHRSFNFVPAQSSAFAEQIYQGRPYPMTGRRDGSVAAIMIGALASITGAAILVYANRPECRGHEFANGCGYGTKVVGGAVLSGGIVGLFVGALTWR